MNANAALRAYVEYWRVSLRALTEYRLNFAFWAVFRIVYHATAIASLWILAHRFNAIGGWSFEGVFFLYSLWALSYEVYTSLFVTVADLPLYVQNGGFDQFLIRPHNLLFQLIVQNRTVPDGIITALLYFVAASRLIHVEVTPTFVFFVALTVGGGAVIDLAINLFIATLSFWLVNTDAARWMIWNLERDLTRYPISIYPAGMRFVLTFIVPFALINYYPASYMIQSAAGHAAPWLAFANPIGATVLFVASYSFFRMGVKRYSSTGT